MSHPRAVALAALVLFAAGCPASDEEPELGALPGLLAARQFDEVERRLTAQLRMHPDDDRARVLLAQVTLGRPDSKPGLALETLGKVSLRDPAALAVVRLNQGKAFSALDDFGAAERAWLDALKLDPKIPEAGWALLGLYDTEGRRDEARRLAWRLRAIEPDPRDRAQLLLELLRQDAMPLEPGSVAGALQNGAERHPDDLPTAIGLGRALVRGSKAARGLPLLRAALTRHPDAPEAWDGLLSSLDDAGAYDELTATLARLPRSLAAEPRFAHHFGRDAQERRDWSCAAEAYLRAWRAGAWGRDLAYRLSRALRFAGRPEEADHFDRKVQAFEVAQAAALGLYREANASKNLGLNGGGANLNLYRRLASLREDMGRPDEALAWSRLALGERPDDPASLAAVRRLEAGGVGP